MFALDGRRTLWVTMAAAAISCLAASGRLAAANPEKGEEITFTGSGTFAATPVSGNDLFMLAGQQFTVSIVGNSARKPILQGNGALFEHLRMTGTIYSDLIYACGGGPAPCPISVSSSNATIAQRGEADGDLFQVQFPVKVQGIALTGSAYFLLPAGTLTTAVLRPFSSVALGPASGTVTYSNASAATVLAVESGTLVGTAPGANITYTASGTFAPAPVSGQDMAHIAGQPFTVSIVGNSLLAPVLEDGWETFQPLQMTGTLYSGLVPNTPINVSNATGVIAQEAGSNEDIFQAGFLLPAGTFPGNIPALTVQVYFILPAGTLRSARLQPFSSIALDPASGTVSYSDTTATTVLAVESGTLVATVPASGPVQ